MVTAAIVVPSVYFTVGKDHSDSAQRYVNMGAGTRKGERLNTDFANSSPPSSTSEPSAAIIPSSKSLTTEPNKPFHSPTSTSIPPQPTADGVYLVNHNSSNGGLSGSGFAYYKNIRPGQNVGQQPDDYAVETTDTYAQWEDVKREGMSHLA
jgi:hypothetical protein